MKCSRCILWQHGCLDPKYHAEHEIIVQCGDSVRTDSLATRPCRAMRAVMKLARKARKAGACTVSPERRKSCDCSHPSDSMTACVDCLARWATR